MKKILTSILLIGTTAILLSSCQKNEQVNPQSAASQATPSARGDYGPGAVYEVELSANIGGKQGGGVWLWIGLYPDMTGDYSGADCGHGEGASSDKGDATWTYNQAKDSLIISGVVLNGFGGFPTTITVPSKYGHYSGTAGSFETLPQGVPGFLGKSELQVAP